MKCFVLAAAIAGLLTTAAHAHPPACKSRAAEKGARVDCDRLPAKARARARDSGMTRADEEKLDGAMSRNVLQSIEDEVRRRRIGN